MEDREITIACDGIFVAAGYLPQSEWVKGQVELDERGYILVDPRTMRTNLSMVYAAGDVTVKRLRQVITACADGAIAANEVKNELSKQ